LTYLNVADPSEAMQNYERNGCFTTISNTLGYRLTLESVRIYNSTTLSFTKNFVRKKKKKKNKQFVDN
jgi:hypothetical protein